MGWETLESRRKKHRLILFYKMVNNLTPEYLSSLIPLQQHTVNTRFNLRNIRTISFHTHAYNSSFLPSSIRDWNALPEYIQSSESLSIFKLNLNKNKPKANPLFNIGSRKGQILHTRLRLGCSSLNDDLYRRSLVDSNRCSCGEIETVDHYLLHCKNYHRLRAIISSNVQFPLTLSNLLYG